jgi:hypothetical protein
MREQLPPSRGRLFYPAPPADPPSFEPSPPADPPPLDPSPPVVAPLLDVSPSEPALFEVVWLELALPLVLSPDATDEVPSGPAAVVTPAPSSVEFDDSRPSLVMVDADWVAAGAVDV